MPLPLILAGPILRRVDPNHVSVWVACTQKVDLTLKLFDGFEVDDSDPTDLDEVETTSATAETFRFGKRLFVGVVTAKPRIALQASKVYSYNVRFQSPTDAAVKGDLRSEGFLTDGTHNGRKQLPIGYENDKLPSFSLSNPDPEKLFLAQASCRKMHGHGPDALAHLDKVIQDNRADADKRPQQLFLTGDQVYADDVPGSFLRHVGVVDAIGIGLDETVQVDRPDGSNGEVEVDITTWPPYLRQGLMSKIAGFSSGSAKNHVISFTEYASLYLAYWSNRAWNLDLVEEVAKVIPDNKDSVLTEVATSLLDSTAVEDDPNLKGIFDQARARGGADFEMALTSALEKAFVPASSSAADVAAQQAAYADFLESIRKALKRELKELAGFAAALPKVSRVLANVASYMIFDDHEVTDDWYLSQRWKNQVLGKRLGRDTVRNGLMAYAVFQDWGNVPDEYVPKPAAGETAATLKPRTRLIRRIVEYCEALSAVAPPATPPRPSAVADIETLLGLGDAPPVVKWHYQVRTGPTTTFVLDTRTRREFESLNSPPGLLTKEAVEEQIPAINPAGGVVPFTLVVSAAPAPGLGSFEEIVQPGAAAVVGIRGGSEENPGALEGMIDYDFEAWGFGVAAVERLYERLSKHKKVIVFGGDVHYGFSSVLDYWEGTQAAPAARILTFTSSAAKNEAFGLAFLYRSAVVQKLLTGLGNNLEKLGWRDRVLSVSGPASIKNRQRLRTNPAVIPVAGWQPGSTVSRAPDFRWRLRVLTDESPRADDPVTADPNLSDPVSTAGAYEKTATRHQVNFISGVHRRMVWPANVGLLRFEGTGAALTAKHDFLFVPGSRDISASSAGTHIKHSARLVASGGETARPELP